MALGLIAIVVAVVLRTGPHTPVQTRMEKRRLAKEKKGPPRWRRALDTGSPRISFAIGAVLSFPGASYLVALGLIHKEDLGTTATVAVVVAFCLVMLMILELPLLGYQFAPEWTLNSVERFQTWVTTDARQIAVKVAFAVGVVLIARGAIEFLG